MIIRPFDPRVNYTRVHNYVIDHMMPELKPNSWKLLCFILRKTTGWGKDAEQLSYSQLRDGTGIKSDPTLSAAIKELLDHSYITVRNDGKWDANTYSLNTTIEIDASIKTIVEPTIEITVEPTIETIDTKRKGKKETKESSSRAEKSTPPTPPATQTIIAAYIEVRGKNGINYGKEGSFAKKIVKDGYSPEQVKGCYLWMKAEPWWLDKPVTLDVIFKHLPEYTAWVERTITPVKAKEDTIVDIDWSKV